MNDGEWARPHHDGSVTYVPEQTPTLGGSMPVFLRVPRASDVTQLPGCGSSRTASRSWCRRWSIDRTSRTRGCAPTCQWSIRWCPTASCSTADRNGYQWLNGSGLHGRDVADAARLPAQHLRPARRTGPPARCTRSSRTGSPSPVDRPAPGLGGPGGLGRPGDRRGPGHAAPALRRRPRRRSSRTWTTSPRSGVGTLYLTPFFPARVQPPLQRLDLRPGRPAARRRRGVGPAGRRRARPRACA